MEEKKRFFTPSDYKKIKNNPLISKEMLNFVRKKMRENRIQTNSLSDKTTESIKKFHPELIAKVIKKLLQE